MKRHISAPAERAFFKLLNVIPLLVRDTGNRKEIIKANKLTPVELTEFRRHFPKGFWGPVCPTE